MILKYLKGSTQKLYLLLFALVIIPFTFTCKEFIPELNKNPKAEFCWGRVKYTLQVKFYAKEHPSFDPSELEYVCAVEQLSDDPDGEVVHYKWDFGDGTTGEGENPFHYYEKEGKYFVELTVMDDDDFDDTIIKEVEVYAENTLPKAVLSTNSSSNTEDINFVWQFDGSESYDPDGRICNYKFEISRHPDDILIAKFEGNRNNIVYVFKVGDLGGKDKESANFKVQLTVTDDHGATDEILMIITVNDA